MTTTNQSFQNDDEVLLYYDSDISFPESLSNVDCGDIDGPLLLDAADDGMEPMQLSTTPVDHNETAPVNHNGIDANGNDSRNNTLKPPKQIVYYPSPQQYQNDNQIIQMLQTQLAFVRHEYLCLHAHTQVSLSQLYQLIYCLAPPQPMVNSTQSGGGAGIVIGEPSVKQTEKVAGISVGANCLQLPAEDIQTGIPTRGKDKCKRNPRRCGLCFKYEDASKNEQSNMITCKGRMGGKNGGQIACQYFTCDGQKKNTSSW